MVKGMVFDIQKFSLQDGPGIRTAIFLKGCSLRCLWCHNPESQSFQKELSFKKEKCVYCGRCETVCPQGVHSIANSTHSVDYNKCTGCGRCVDACAFDALKLYGRVMEVHEIIDEAAKDIRYYEKSGGGITLSGGEPLAQPAFALEILKAAREMGIHTCIETSGSCPREVLEAINRYTDLFLFDCKATDPAKHMELTGVSNDLIMDNLQFLYDSGSSIILRCPLVPGINDSPGHLRGIADLCHKYTLLKGIELLPYHDMGRDKYKETGREYSLSHLKNTDEIQKQKWLDFLASLGCSSTTQ